MTKAELMTAIKANLGNVATKSLIEKVYDAIEEEILKALKKGESLAVLGLGSMKTVTRSARKGRNPRTGEAMKIPARKVAKFTASKALKDALAKK